MKKWLVGTLIVWFVTFVAAYGHTTECTYPKGHSHDDYERTEPLQTALDAGFESVGLRAWYISSQVRICDHYTVNCGSDKAFNALYLDELLSVTPMSLFRIEIDLRITTPLFKWTAITNTYNDVVAAMQARPTLQSWVEITFTGTNQNFPPPSGNPSYIKFRAASNYYLVDAGWPYTWNGVGAMPSSEAADLATRISNAHNASKLIMFGPYSKESNGDAEAIWDVLRTAGVDYISTEDPARYTAWGVDVCTPEPQPDAGADSGTPDAGADSGTPDAG